MQLVFDSSLKSSFIAPHLIPPHGHFKLRELKHYTFVKIHTLKQNLFQILPLGLRLSVYGLHRQFNYKVIHQISGLYCLNQFFKQSMASTL